VIARIRYLPALDGLRGVAVAAVLLFHGGHLEGGYIGVDVFFVLSGFLITSLLLAETDKTSRIALGAFWARRARRLLPALGLVLLAVALYARVVAQPSELHQIRDDALATMAYGANWHFVFERVSYWSLFASPSPLQHTWSLAIEEQFYLLWPLILAVVIWWRSRRKTASPLAPAVLVLSAVLALASGIWGLVLYHYTGGNRIYYGTDTRAEAILLGAALAALVTMRGPVATVRGRVVVQSAGAVGATWLVIAFVVLPGTSPMLYEGGLLVCSLAATAVIAAVVQPTGSPVGWALRARPLIWLGIISYGVYLWHWPIFLWIGRTTDLRGWGLFLAQVGVTVVVAVASFVLVERPIRQGALRRSGRRLGFPAVAGAAAVVLAAVLFATVGARPPVTISASASASASTSRSQSTPVVPGGQAAPRLMLVGNSVPWFLAGEGFEQLQTKPPLTVLNAAYPSCAWPPESNAFRLNQTNGTAYLAEDLPCTRGWTTAVASFRPDVVLFTIGALEGEFRDGRTGQWLSPCSPEFDSWFETALRQAVGVLTVSGAHLVLATSAYSEYYGIPSNVWVQADCMNDIERAIAKTDQRVSLVDLAHWVCPKFDACRETIDGVPMRPDGLHYRNQSAVAVASWLLPQLGLRDGGGLHVTMAVPGGGHPTS
jgi:peptidoglycan/LPS O-acetylase OafA/YrhL